MGRGRIHLASGSRTARSTISSQALTPATPPRRGHPPNPEGAEASLLLRAPPFSSGLPLSPLGSSGLVRAAPAPAGDGAAAPAWGGANPAHALLSPEHAEHGPPAPFHPDHRRRAGLRLRSGRGRRGTRSRGAGPPRRPQALAPALPLLPGARRLAHRRPRVPQRDLAQRDDRHRRRAARGRPRRDRAHGDARGLPAGGGGRRRRRGAPLERGPRHGRRRPGRSCPCRSRGARRCRRSGDACTRPCPRRSRRWSPRACTAPVPPPRAPSLLSAACTRPSLPPRPPPPRSDCSRPSRPRPSPPRRSRCRPARPRPARPRRRRVPCRGSAAPRRRQRSRTSAAR